MSPRANFECRSCEKTIEDLPVECTRCPICNKKRGFRRLYDTLRVNRRRPRPARYIEGKQAAAKYIDEKLQPAYDAHAKRKASAKNFEDGVKEATARVYEQATPEVREQIVKQGNGMALHRNVTAAAAFSSIDPQARMDSRTHTFPATRRVVKPIWQN